MGMDEKREKVDFEVQESVKVISGPFENFVGVIEAIDIKSSKLKVLVDLFGRETPVELDFDQVQKI
jgi:transcriptional antiterminator NusG